MIEKFCKYFEGYFNNRKQAFSYPSKFALIELYHEKINDSKFRVRQKYAMSQTFYRESIVKIIENNNYLLLKNYKNNEENEISGCDVLIVEKEDEFFGKNISNQCIVKNGGKDTYLITESILGNGYYKVIDRGYDLYTNEQIWGSYNGFFCFDRITS